MNDRIVGNSQYLTSGDLALKMMEILFFAFLTGYMIFRLWSILGKRDGFEGPPSTENTGKKADNVIPMPVRPLKEQITTVDDSTTTQVSSAVEIGIKKLQAADPSFNLDPFLSGAVRAFEMIVEAYAKGDKDTLKPLLSPAVYKSFVSDLKDREESGQTVETKIIKIRDPEVLDIAIKGKQEQITLKFTSDQITITKDAKGQILDNPAHLSLTMNDIWTFSRTIGSKNPNWVLVATRIEGN
jgi:predicted lipid-binding transport protein (Tim44 family)